MLNDVIVKDDLQTYWNWMEEFGEEVGGMGGRIMGWYRGPNPVITTTCPEILKEVFIKDAENFVDRPLLDRSDNIPHLINMRHVISTIYPEKNHPIFLFCQLHTKYDLSEIPMRRIQTHFDFYLKSRDNI